MAIPSILTIGESGTGSALRTIVRLVTRQRVERDFSNAVSYSREPRIDLCCAGVVPAIQGCDDRKNGNTMSLKSGLVETHRDC
jgi:hypothetical protein